jgi:Phage phiEco32-like COOH.NH2 ligase-type 2
VFDKDQMDHPNAHVFGCEPDFNAWTLKANPSPQPPHPFMRSAGGHIHVETKEDPVEVVRAMDVYLGVPSVLMDEGEDRKQLYGTAGAHRIKPYGVEYRTLSNFWIFEKKYVDWVWAQTERSIANLGVADRYQDLILEAINNNNKEVAQELVKELNLEVV